MLIVARRRELLAALLLLLICGIGMWREYKIWLFLEDLDVTAHPDRTRGAFWQQLLWKQHPFLLQMFLCVAGAVFLAMGKRPGWFIGTTAAALSAIHFFRLVLHPTGSNTSATTLSWCLLANAVVILLLLNNPPVREKHRIAKPEAVIVIVLLLLLMVDKWVMLG